MQTPLSLSICEIILSSINPNYSPSHEYSLSSHLEAAAAQKGFRGKLGNVRNPQAGGEEKESLDFVISFLIKIMRL